jgi:hypothetical protein
MKEVLPIRLAVRPQVRSVRCQTSERAFARSAAGMTARPHGHDEIKRDRVLLRHDVQRLESDLEAER